MNKLVINFILWLCVFAFAGSVHGQPYINTHIENKYVKQNVFIGGVPDTIKPPEFRSIKDKLPQPVWTGRPDVLKCYWRAWEIAFSNLKPVPAGSGFVSPFIDPAFNEHIFMWDCSFMTMFGKYASQVFSFQATLDNFYARQHADGFICREIREKDGTDCFERFDPSSTGPNIMPWAEWEYFLNFNDTVRLSKVFPALLANYEWFHTNRSWPDGSYYSSGWGCGMDNQPRLPRNLDPNWNHAHMSWIDVSLQQVFAGSILIEMAEKLHRKGDVKEIEDETEKLKNYINSSMWDEKKGFYFDRMQDGTLSDVKSIASYWALLSGVVPQGKSGKLIAHLENPAEFDRFHRVPSLSADHPDFNPEGGYWRGAVWAPTNYMVLRGLTRYGYDSLAYEIASNHVNNVVEVFTQSADLRENYAPDKVQGNNGRNFVGWTGLVPISDLFEYVFGIRPDVPANTLVIDVRLTDEYGIRQYPFGKTGFLDILCAKRASESEKPSLTIQSNVPLKIILKWKGGSISSEIEAGRKIKL
ncbi:MAG: trehalase family glycosidase [Bacteroidota bacterium]